MKTETFESSVAMIVAGLAAHLDVAKYHRALALLVFLNANRKNPQTHEITVVAFTRNYSGYRIFHREQRYFF
jgi:hypothetical protein